HMVVHGVLHLRGFDHIDPADAEKMEAKERRILSVFRVPDPYQEVA
ncbi:MAG TPA: rRNA maturation RNase YbeY, partial [Chromatiaceae bacterium]|nr:rRNA maturation RNase YbeY [Chromatiaceae bacterium]